MKKILVFASGSKDGGGSGFERLVGDSRSGILEAQIMGVISNHSAGGVFERAERLGVPFEHFLSPHDAAGYRRITEKYQPDLIVLAGWLKLVVGLENYLAINIHPGPLPRFGGKGMHGMHVHEAVLKAGVDQSAVSIHFVNAEYDAGDLIFAYPVPVYFNDTSERLQKRVNKFEHWCYGAVVNLVLNHDATSVSPEQLPPPPPLHTVP